MLNPAVKLLVVENLTVLVHLDSYRELHKKPRMILTQEYVKHVDVGNANH
jgi:hypothetical protein